MAQVSKWCWCVAIVAGAGATKRFAPIPLVRATNDNRSLCEVEVQTHTAGEVRVSMAVTMPRVDQIYERRPAVARNRP